MSNLKKIKTRINSIKSTQQITRAMKLVASAKFQKAQTMLKNSLLYQTELKKIFKNLLCKAVIFQSPYFEEREIKNEGIIILTSDRGLCGSFNNNIIKRLKERVEKNKEKGINTKIWVIGKKGKQYLEKSNLDIKEYFIGVYNKLEPETASKILLPLLNLYKNKEIDNIVFIYNAFKSTLVQTVSELTILPISINIETDNEYYLYEPDYETLLNYTIENYLVNLFYRIIIESMASENAARMTAMDNATNNAKELINILTIKYNRERQAVITKEISEIVGGAAALE
ncbi:MAG TPA: ATP synthase F1 subunit gamma [bacterium]|nr:ATP synthase F1 subunit gamma [bacterium]HPQ19437.1 ATP synthase F1 subunit gamma [bacterium]